MKNKIDKNLKLVEFLEKEIREHRSKAYEHIDKIDKLKKRLEAVK